MNRTLCALLLGLSLTSTAWAQANRPGPLTLYTDAANHLTLQYPSAWKRVSGPQDYGQTAVVGSGSHSGADIPITFAVEFTGKGSPYEKTNLESMAFSFGTVKNISEDRCTAIARSITAIPNTPKSAAVGPLQFDFGHGIECGLGHQADARVYTRFSGDRCYVLEADFFYYTGAPAGSRNLTSAEIAALYRPLDRVIQSVRIASTMLPRSWRTTVFRDPATGVSFEYPAAMHPQRDVTGYIPPALTQMKGIIWRARLAYFPPGVPKADEATTDLSELAFLFATKSTVSEAGCARLAEDQRRSNGTQDQAVSIGGVRFTVTDTSDAGLSHSLDGRLYATFRSGTCFLFEEEVAGLDGYAGDVTEAQWKEIRRHMDAIVQTIRLPERKE